MSHLIDHVLKLTEHKDRDLLDLTLAKALIQLLPIQRVVVAQVLREEGVRRWFDRISLDARGGGKVVDPMRVQFHTLWPVEDNKERLQCLQTRERVEFAWAGPDGPRIYFVPLYGGSETEQEGVLELHAPGTLDEAAFTTLAQVHRVFCNMHRLLAYSDRDALTGLLNRKSLDDTFYSAVLEEMDYGVESTDAALEAPVLPVAERRHRVPPNYWLGVISVDHFKQLSERGGHLITEEILLLVARVMGNTFRTYDRLYRFGGPQFAVLMHCPDEALVLAAFERLRANVEKFNFPQVGHITASAGFTRVLPDDSPSTTLERAEQAVAYAKNSAGYNSVFGHAELVRKGVLGQAAKVGGVDLFES